MIPSSLLVCCIQLLCTFAIRLYDCLEIAAQYCEWRLASAILKVHDRRERRLLAQAFDVGASEAFQVLSEMAEVDVRRDRNLPAAQAHDGRAIGHIGLRKLEHVVEAPATQ